MRIEGRAVSTPTARSRATLRLALGILAGSAFGALGGCATAPGASGASATCTDLISAAGGLLKFCQAGDKLRVTESGIDPAAAADDVKIVDDPAVLNALQKQISPRPAFQASRRIVARACVVKGGDFVSISLADLKRIIDAPVRARAVSPEAGPAGARAADAG